MKVLITGSAGFIGTHLANRLSNSGYEVLGVDNYNSYYNVDLKHERVNNLLGAHSGIIREVDIQNNLALDKIFESFRPNVVVNLAAQAGVRIPENFFHKYYETNINGFINVSDLVRKYNVGTYLYASSSSVYGNSINLPFNEDDLAIRPISIYGVTKLFNELHANVFFKDDSTKAIGMRFFTVYGPWGRPDMAYFRIVNSLMNGSIFTKFGQGNLKRDFTFVSDTVESIARLIRKGSTDSDRSNVVLNIGGGNPVSLNELITSLESVSGREINIRQEDASNADVDITFADYNKLENYIEFKPNVSVQQGAAELLSWALSVEKSKMQFWVNG